MMPSHHTVAVTPPSFHMCAAWGALSGRRKGSIFPAVYLFLEAASLWLLFLLSSSVGLERKSGLERISQSQSHELFWNHRAPMNPMCENKGNLYF